MIQNKSDLQEFLECDKRALGRTEKHPKANDLIWKYEIELRYCEYYKNCRKGFINCIVSYLHKYRKFRLGRKCNFSIPENAFGKGLSIAHIGTIGVNSGAHIGENCRIHVGVIIGASIGSPDEVPQIGNNVYIGPGAKLFGKITIADGVAIGANAVVNKDCLEENVSLGGVPAKIISHKGSKARLRTFGESGEKAAEV